MNRRDVALALLLAVSFAGCGKKGPPLAPLHLVPAAVTSPAVKRVGNEARLSFVLPTANSNGPGPIDLVRVEVYAITLVPGITAPNRLLFSPEFTVGSIDIEPAPEERGIEADPKEEPKKDDPRPAPGEPAVFIETLDEKKLTPAELPADLLPPPAPAAAPAAAAPVAPVAPLPTAPVRIYAMRGVTKSGRYGPPSTRVELPIVPVPPPPTGVTAKQTETAVVVAWSAPAEPAGLQFNVYRAKEPGAPLNATPLATPSYDHPNTEMNAEQCFAVRSVQVAGVVTIESETSEPVCLTTKDIFAPAAPTGFQLVASPGAINLIWNPNKEPDLAGYIVLRGEAGSDTLQPLTPTPIGETTYRDTSVTPGVRYVYAVVAVDRASPPNVSAQSPRQEETAR